MTEPNVGTMRVWHIPQIPGEPFHVFVESVQEAKRVLNLLANYDIFQFENNIKPDYCNAQGLEVYEADGGDGAPDWCEWCDEETGCEIGDWDETETAQ